ncbi:kinase-like domain-containing protein [Rhizophagus clarus]|uniref:Kinase-like domain-containing protein n=1 Tax=Rhizophagus clarus TaxID=94130 RepID=A0A8H3QZX1_9GLOM|nr:kinase-like domain-containing protein [Rhizophagus clarus]
MVHRDFHIGNILFTKKEEIYTNNTDNYSACISDMGLCRKIDDIDETTTGKQPFSDCAHDVVLALEICSGTRPEIEDQIAPKCYIDLMK